MQSMMTIDAASQLIREGKCLLISGDEKLLAKLPLGNWVGGTSPYFMSEDGGLTSKDRVQVIVLPDFVRDVAVKFYTANELPQIPSDYKQNGFSYIIVPAFSEAHETFARDCSLWPGVFNRPLVGWIAGIDVADIGKASPKVFNGQTGKSTSDQAIVLHADLPPTRFANVNIINLFTQSDGDTIAFDQTGFEVSHCLINGEKRSLAQYVKERGIDTKLPLVADYHGAMVNVSFQSVDAIADKVVFYAPVFPGIEYKIAKPVGAYESEFRHHIEGQDIEPVFTCNCILNYLYANLEGKKTGHMVGPITFGEIAYMLLNQTLVYLTFGTA